jgi:hypothetical protein
MEECGANRRTEHSSSLLSESKYSYKTTPGWKQPRSRIVLQFRQFLVLIKRLICVFHISAETITHLRQISVYYSDRFQTNITTQKSIWKHKLPWTRSYTCPRKPDSSPLRFHLCSSSFLLADALLDSRLTVHV